MNTGERWYLRCAAIAALVMGLSAGAAAAQTATVTATGVTVRAEPATKGAIIAIVPKGALLEILEKRGDWYMVRLSPDARGVRLTGYIHSTLVLVQPASAPGGPSPAPQVGKAPIPPPSAGAKPPAASQKTSTRRPRRPLPFAPRGFLAVGSESFRASQSLTAMFGDASGGVVGGGAEVSFARRFFIQVSAGRTRMVGQRVFVFGGEVFPLGLADTVTLTPVDVTGGYRFSLGRRFTPYAGGGLGSLSFKEESAFADGAEDVNGRFLSYHIMGGVEFTIHKWIAVAAEIRVRSVPNAIGKDGVSAEFHEPNLGGTAIMFRILLGPQPPRRPAPPKRAAPPLKPPAPKRFDSEIG
jgi:opacity protein-like surface antigen